MVKVYEVYPNGGRFEVQSKHYNGSNCGIAATSIKQALFFAYKNIWADLTSGEDPKGILWTYTRDKGWSHWTGEKNWKEGPRHGVSKTAILKIYQDEIN